MAKDRVADETEPSYQHIVESAQDAILVAQDGCIRLANTQAETLLGYSREQLYALPFVSFIHPEDRELVLRRHKARLGGEQPPDSYVFRVVDASGQPIWVAIKAVVTTWKGRAATFNFLTDIREQKRAEEQAARLEDKLRQAQKLEGLGRLAGGVAHDMNNILGAILNLSSTVAAEMHPGDRWAEDLGQIRALCQRGRDLTANLLGFAREGKYVTRALDLNDCIGRVAALLGRTAPKTVRVVTTTSGDPLVVEGDRSQLDQLLVNVCLNAVDALGDGGTLRIESSACELGASELHGEEGTAPGAYALLRVGDDGCGMDAETMASAFDPFFTTKPPGRGTGLGLSMAYGAVRAHGGMVRLQSQVGVGTTVSIYLPLSDAPLGQHPSPPPPHSDVPRPARVLVIDDEALVARASARLLRSLGFEVLTASSGMEGLELYRQKLGAIDLVVLDLVMPEVDGSQTFAQLRRLDPEARVLLASGYSHDETAQRLLDAGAAGFLQKPFDRNQLAELLDSMQLRAPS